jgi:hypothetical protein
MCHALNVLLRVLFAIISLRFSPTIFESITVGVIGPFDSLLATFPEIVKRLARIRTACQTEFATYSALRKYWLRVLTSYPISDTLFEFAGHIIALQYVFYRSYLNQPAIQISFSPSLLPVFVSLVPKIWSLNPSAVGAICEMLLPSENPPSAVLDRLSADPFEAAFSPPLVRIVAKSLVIGSANHSRSRASSLSPALASLAPEIIRKATASVVPQRRLSRSSGMERSISLPALSGAVPDDNHEARAIPT